MPPKASMIPIHPVYPDTFTTDQEIANKQNCTDDESGEREFAFIEHPPCCSS